MSPLKKFSFFCFAILFLSCSKSSNDNLHVEELSFTNEIISKYNGKSETGELSLIYNVSNEAAIKFNNEENKLIFFIQKDETLINNIEISEYVQLIYFDDLVLINSPKKKELFVFTINRDEAITVVNEIKTISDRELLIREANGLATYYLDEYEFSGITFVHGETFFESMSKVKGKEFLQVSSSLTCDSGGPGSTSCSTSNPFGSCNTSCSTGYYACCDKSLNKCKCFPTTAPGESD